MKSKTKELLRRYQPALRNFLQRGPKASVRPAQILGRQALALGLETLDLARVHELALVPLVLPGGPAGVQADMIRRAGYFFAAALSPIENSHRTARESNLRLGHLNRSLHQRSVALVTANQQLKQEIVRRLAAESSLKKSEQHYSRLLVQSQHLQEQLRSLSRQLLLAQEEERKKISRELHDEVAQVLTGINLELVALKHAATINTADIRRKIANTQRLVEKSVNIVHRFARNLRPTILDDLGLIPALHSFVKSIVKRTRIRVHMRIYAGVEQLDNARRTVMYRVTQEALTNAVRHAQATRVTVDIQQRGRTIGLAIQDNGQSFDVQSIMRSKGKQRLGLLGMRERVEMVGGQFSIESAPGQGTTIRADIPAHNGLKRKKSAAQGDRVPGPSP